MVDDQHRSILLVFDTREQKSTVFSEIRSKSLPNRGLGNPHFASALMRPMRWGAEEAGSIGESLLRSLRNYDVNPCLQRQSSHLEGNQCSPEDAKVGKVLDMRQPKPPCARKNALMHDCDPASSYPSRMTYLTIASAAIIFQIQGGSSVKQS